MSVENPHECLDSCPYQKLKNVDKNKILEIVDKSESQLIAALEIEMQASLQDIDFSKDEEANIELADVNDWYISSEKVLRVVANLFASPMHQAVNQLRYAGHHVLKAILSDDPVVAQAETVEAYKHCKRSVYDALDAYIYQTNRLYKNVLPFLVDSEAVKLERTLREHLTEIANARDSSSSRIEYYELINEKLIEGLRVTEQLNQIQRDSGFSTKVFLEKKQLVAEINDLRTVASNLDVGRKEALFELEKKTKKRSIILSWIAYLTPIIALFFAIYLQATITSSYDVNLGPKVESQNP